MQRSRSVVSLFKEIVGESKDYYRREKMLRIAVVEDHPRMQRVVCGYIEKAKEEFPEIQTRTYCCGEDFLQVKERYDILILDIDLPGISGIELGHRLRKNGDDTAVVFLTAYPQYGAESYVIEAWQYVLKEQMEERFPEILHRLISSLLEEKKDYRIVGDGCGKEKLYYRDILYIQKDKKGGKYAEYVTGEKIYRERISIGRLLEEIGDERFILLDRGHVLNVQHIEKLERGWVYLLGGHRFSVSRIQYSHIKERIACYMEGL